MDYLMINTMGKKFYQFLNGKNILLEKIFISIILLENVFLHRIKINWHWGTITPQVNKQIKQL